MSYKILPVLWVAAVGLSLAAECGVGHGKRCIFPFEFKNVTYAGCTEVGDPNRRLWCSVQVNDQGEHMTGKGAWEHCEQECPTARERLYPDCGELKVTDQDEDFSSGIYTVDQGRNHGGRTVYVNKENKLFIFWLHDRAGWGLGYESGFTSGGSFYSSGPDVRGEPWLGAWKESMLKIECTVSLPFVNSVTTIPNESPGCPDRHSCLARENCPEVEKAFQSLLGRSKNDPSRKETINRLKKKVCNKQEKGFCCREEDESVCREDETCTTIQNCPSNREKVSQIESGTLPHAEISQVYQELKATLCDSRKKMFCCSGDNISS